MKVMVELPDTTMCVFANYLFINDAGETSMGVKTLCTDDLHQHRIVEGNTKIIPKYEYKKGGAE